MPAYQYSFVGPVSISKGCDLARPKEVVTEFGVSDAFLIAAGQDKKDIFSSSDFRTIHMNTEVYWENVYQLKYGSSNNIPTQA